MPLVTAIVSKKTNRISLVQGHDYQVIGIENTDFRIIDESGEPSLYPKSYFLDDEIIPPADWEYKDYGDGEYTYSPSEFTSRGFFEKHADGQEDAVQAFKCYVERKL